jgi:large subunit ribosomal protein L9
MKVILQKSVQKLGKIGDVVEASPGYFRNYLEPRGLAMLATGGALKKREEDLETLRKKAETAHQAAVEVSEKIQALNTIQIAAKAGESGRLFGKITSKEIAQALSKEANVEIDKKSLKTPEDMSALGTYKITAKIAPEVQAEFSIEIIPE